MAAFQGHRGGIGGDRVQSENLWFSSERHPRPKESRIFDARSSRDYPIVAVLRVISVFSTDSGAKKISLRRQFPF